jgi:hypothetical protein
VAFPTKIYWEIPRVKDYFSFTLLVAIATLLAPTVSSAGIYKYLDENGRIAYSDKPVEGAKKMKVQRQPTPQQDQSTDDEETAEVDEDGEVTSYKSLKVLNPTQGKVISDRSGSVQVIFLPSPRLSAQHQLVINVDGKDISRGKHANLNLSNVHRGSHTVSGRIVDADGNLMIESPSVTFHVRRNGEELAFK